MAYQSPRSTRQRGKFTGTAQCRPVHTAQIASNVSWFPKGLQTYVWVADEVWQCASLFPQIRQWAQAIHRGGSKTLITMPATPALFDDGLGTGRSAVDIWTIQPSMWNASADSIAKAQAKGDSIWSYNGLVQDSYSPKWEIDFPLINYRIQLGFISQSLGIAGVLYWRADWWPTDPWYQVNTEGLFDANNYPGEGLLVYPGAEAGLSGFVPSIRLKQLRDGIQDYEYINLMKKLGLSTAATNISKSVGADWKHWTKSPQALESARKAAASAIEATMAATGQNQNASLTAPTIRRL